MDRVVDYSFARPDPAAIKAAGYVGVMRYLSWSNPQSDGKILSIGEKDALEAAGLTVGLVWEYYAARASEGQAAGVADATEALRQSDALGHHGAIYFAVDYDAPESDQAGIDAYFWAAATIIGFSRLGAYAGYWPLKRLFDAGLITFGWQTSAWSGGNWESRSHLRQTGEQDFNGNVDINEVLQTNWGQILVPKQGEAMASLASEGDVNEILRALTGLGIEDNTGFKQWVSKPWPEVFNEIYAIPEAVAFRDKQAKAFKALEATPAPLITEPIQPDYILEATDFPEKQMIASRETDLIDLDGLKVTDTYPQGTIFRVSRQTKAGTIDYYIRSDDAKNNTWEGIPASDLIDYVPAPPVSVPIVVAPGATEVVSIPAAASTSTSVPVAPPALSLVPKPKIVAVALAGTATWVVMQILASHNVQIGAPAAAGLTALLTTMFGYLTGEK